MQSPTTLGKFLSLFFPSGVCAPELSGKNQTTWGRRAAGVSDGGSIFTGEKGLLADAIQEIRVEVGGLLVTLENRAGKSTCDQE